MNTFCYDAKPIYKHFVEIAEEGYCEIWRKKDFSN